MRKIFYFLISVILFPLCLLAQQRVVGGRITDSKDGTPLSGVSVSANNKVLATTNASGAYSVALPANATQLVFSYVGMKTITETIAGRKVIDISMASSDDQLANVVVVGYTTQRKETLTGAVSAIKGSDEDLSRKLRLLILPLLTRFSAAPQTGRG